MTEYPRVGRNAKSGIQQPDESWSDAMKPTTTITATCRKSRSTRVPRLAAGAVMAGAALMASVPAQATCDPEPYIGSLCMTAASFCPEHYVEAAGQLLPISDYQALAALLGDTYGGDMRTTVGVPDLRGRTPVGLGSGTGLTPVYRGQRRGWESVTMTERELPSHSHAAAFQPDGGGGVQVTIPVSGNTSGNQNVPDAGHSYLAGSPGGPNGAQMWSNTMNQVATVKGVTASGGGGGGTVTVDKTGGNQAIPTVPPQLGMRYCIATEGLWPPRP
ncbi:phage tail protein [Billgrantia azerbaijanica]|nr:phage tail protein [Halomonas azerbaijanica]